MAQQQIITKPHVEELQDNDSLFINHDGALRQIKKSVVDFASGADIRAEVAAREAFEVQEVAAREAFEKSETEARVQFETSVGEQITEKANVDGYYEEMTVGDAEQLISTQFVEDNKPYLFRPTGGSSDVGNRAYLDKIVGGTVAWNQQLKLDKVNNNNGITASLNNDGSITINGTSTSNAYILIDSRNSFKLDENHKYLYKGCPSGGSGTRYFLGDAWNNMGRDYGSGTIFTATSGTFQPRIVVIEGNTVSNLTFKPSLFDLTQMFGSTIADYIYSLEQSQAGAGVAWFKKLFPKDYYEYNEGELLSVEGLQSHDAVGFNQWDGTGENGRWISDYTTGAVATASNVYNVTNLIRVLPNTSYYHSQTDSSRIIFYDSEKNAIPMLGWQYSDVAGVITTPQNARYVRFTVTNSRLSTFCINLSNPSRNGEYEEYVKHSYPLDSSLTLRGIPKLDASNNLYYDGDEYTSDGKVKRKYGIIDLGTIDWEQGGSNNKTSWVPVSWHTNVKPTKHDSTKANILCSKYKVDTARNVENQTYDKTICVNNGAWVYIYDSAYISVTPQEFKAAMSGVMLVYELATPTTETTEPFQFTQIIDDFGTEEFVSNGFIPAGHVTRYPANLRDKLQHLPSLASAEGTYLIKQTGKQMSLVHTPAVFPETPTEDGTYTLKATVSGGVATLQWVAE